MAGPASSASTSLFLFFLFLNGAVRRLNAAFMPLQAVHAATVHAQKKTHTCTKKKQKKTWRPPFRLLCLLSNRVCVRVRVCAHVWVRGRLARKLSYLTKTCLDCEPDGTWAACKKKKKVYFRVWKVVEALKDLSSDFIAPQLKLEAAAGCSREMQTCNYHSLSPQSQFFSPTFNMFGCVWSIEVPKHMHLYERKIKEKNIVLHWADQLDKKQWNTLIIIFLNANAMIRVAQECSQRLSHRLKVVRRTFKVYSSVKHILSFSPFRVGLFQLTVIHCCNILNPSF